MEEIKINTIIYENLMHSLIDMIYNESSIIQLVNNHEFRNSIRDTNLLLRDEFDYLLGIDTNIIN